MILRAGFHICPKGMQQNQKELPAHLYVGREFACEARLRLAAYFAFFWLRM